MRILVAEDDLSSQILMEELLLPLGNVQVVSNGKEAVNAFVKSREEQKPYDIIFLDIMMPKMDGYEALECIREIEKQASVPFEKRSIVIMLTILHSQESITKSVYEGCDWYIPKPIRKETLFSVLDKISKSDPDRNIFGEVKSILYKSA
ncbi:MAG: response regulator [Firmicutes bacterium]|nr:response regulator [Bacillota bacterium]